MRKQPTVKQEMSNISKIKKFISGKVGGRDFSGEHCVTEFLTWYQENDVMLLIPPFFEMRKQGKKPKFSVGYVPLGIKRVVLYDTNEKIVKKMVEEWRTGECGKRSCIHTESYFHLPETPGSDKHIFIATVFYD